MLQFRIWRTSALTLSLATLFIVFCTTSAFSQTPFYQGKTVALIVGSGPGEMGDLRAKALGAILAKHIPGNPAITFQYMPGGGRKATRYFVNNVRPDGLTLLRVSSSIVPYAVLGESGVQYDIDKLNYLGTTEHTFFTISSTLVNSSASTPWKNCARPKESVSAAARWVIRDIFKAA